MNEMTIKIEIPGLTAAIERLADALRGNGASGREPVPAAAPVLPAESAAPPCAPISAAPVTAAPQPAAGEAAVPAAPTAPAPGYTLEQLSRAGADLIAADPSKLAGLQALLQQFAVQAITMLPADQYGAFATALRGLGASI